MVQVFNSLLEQIRYPIGSLCSTEDGGVSKKKKERKKKIEEKIARLFQKVYKYFIGLFTRLIMQVKLENCTMEKSKHTHA